MQIESIISTIRAQLTMAMKDDEATQPMLQPEAPPHAAVDVSATPEGSDARSWRYPRWRFWGDCSPEDIVAMCLAFFLPPLAFAWNTHRALRIPFVGELARFAAAGLLYLLLHVLMIRAGQIILIILVQLAFCMYGAHRRQQIRVQLGIPEAPSQPSAYWADLLAWTLFWPFSLAQETRTLMAGRVAGGMWRDDPAVVGGAEASSVASTSGAPVKVPGDDGVMV